MAENKKPNPNAVGQKRPPADPYPLNTMFNYISTAYLIAVVVFLPILMGDKKYSAITKFKSDSFTTMSVLTIILMAAAFLLNATTREKDWILPSRKKLLSAPFIADVSIAAYWFFMFISSCFAQNSQLAFFGQSPRNDGFFYQTMYVALYFIISRALVPQKWKALCFTWGGAILAVTCIFHYFGVDLYDVVNYTYIASDGTVKHAALDASYAGPFWDSSSYRFLGPVGNVNLGSYILAVALILTAGFYINEIKPDRDKYNISCLVCFALILYAELNINTDAGLVALAAAVITIPPVLCGSIAHLARILHIYTLSAAVTFFSTWLDSYLCKEPFGTTEKLLVIVTAALGFATLITEFLMRRNREVCERISGRTLRICCGVFVAVLVVGAVSLSLYITRPEEVSTGSLAGAVAVTSEQDLKEKSDSIVHELGQMLRGNFDDSFGHNRLFTWKRTLNLVKLHPIFGIGPDNFRSFFRIYYGDEAKVMFPSSNGGLDKAHNEFLDVLLCNGIVGLICYLAFFGALLYYAFRKAHKGGMAPVFGIAVVGFMAHAFFGYELPIQSPVMWCMIAMTAAFIRTEQKDEPAAFVRTASPAHSR